MGWNVNTDNCGSIRYSSWGEISEWLKNKGIGYIYDGENDTVVVKLDVLKTIDLKSFRKELPNTCFDKCIKECLDEEQDLMLY